LIAILTYSLKINSIQKDLTTPQEYARMKDEYSEALLRQNEYDNGRKAARLENAKKMLAEGIELSFVAEITGLSVEELQKL
jgi:predicted transposase/invertase (TIGR01784 family)